MDRDCEQGSREQTEGELDWRREERTAKSGAEDASGDNGRNLGWDIEVDIAVSWCDGDRCAEAGVEDRVQPCSSGIEQAEAPEPDEADSEAEDRNDNPQAEDESP